MFLAILLPDGSVKVCRGRERGRERERDKEMILLFYRYIIQSMKILMR